MKRSKKLLSLILTVAMVFSVFNGISPVTAAEEAIAIPVTIEENYTMASEMFNIINQKREENGNTLYTMDSGLMEVAMQRAAEICCYFGHGAPSDPEDSGDYLLLDGTVLENARNVKEDIGWGVDASSMYKLWRGSVLHAGALLGTCFNYCGIGAAMYHGSAYWVLIVSEKPLGNAMQPQPGAVNKTHTVNILPRLLSADGLIRRVYADEPQWSDPACFKDALTGDAGYHLETANIVSITNNNPELFTVNGLGQVKGNGKSYGTGSYSITVKGGGTSTVKVIIDEPMRPYGDTFTVKVKGDVFGFADGDPIEPDVSVYYGDEFIHRANYDVSYSNNRNVGTATVTVTGKKDTQLGERVINSYTYGSYVAYKACTGTATFKIARAEDIPGSDVSTPVPTQAPSVTPVTPTPKPPSSEVPEDIPEDRPDFSEDWDELEGEDAPLVMKDKFRIKLSKTTVVYNGKAQEPSFRVFDDDGSEYSPYCYTVTYKNNVKPGTATVTIKGRNGFEDWMGTATFKIVAAKKFTVKLSHKNMSYDGKTKKPAVTVYVGNKKISSKYYSVTYKNNKNIGKATVTVKGKGSYTGSSGTGSFNIIPKKTTISAKSRSKKAVTVKWKKIKGCSGYQVLYSTNKNFKNAKYKKVSSKTLGLTIKGLKSRKTYYVKVRSYKKTGGKYYCSSWSSTKKIKVK